MSSSVGSVSLAIPIFKYAIIFKVEVGVLEINYRTNGLPFEFITEN
jgi:hypothetical protein